MSDTHLTCPYCDAYVGPPDGTTHDGRITCPRCGESFRPAADAVISSPLGGPTSVSTTPFSGPTVEAVRSGMPLTLPEKPRARNRLVGIAIVGLMAVMAGTALTYALITTGLRRDHDTGRSQTERRLPIPTIATAPPDAGPVAPAKLEALGYLPPDTSLIVGVHLAELGEALQGRNELLDTPINAGPVQRSINDLLTWTGFKPKEVHHLVLGIKIEDPLVPRVELIVHTKAVHDPDAVRKKLEAKRVMDDGDRRIDTFKLGDTNVPIVLWCADDHQTFVFGLVPSDVKACPTQPRPGLEQLPHEIRDILQERVGGVGPLWIAGTADDWTKTPAAQLFRKTKAEDRERLKAVHTFAALVQLDQAVTVRGAFDCRNEAGATGLETYLRALGKADNPDLKMVIDDKWLTLQWRTNLDTIVKSLGGGNP
jgi:hypothetical protein